MGLWDTKIVYLTFIVQNSSHIMYEHCFWTIKAEFITKLTVYLCSVASRWSSLPCLSCSWLWELCLVPPSSPCWGGGTVVIAMCGLGFSALMGDPRWPESPGSFFSASGSPCFLFQALLISVLCYRCSNWRPACLLVSSPTPLLFSFFLSLFFVCSSFSFYLLPTWPSPPVCSSIISTQII